VLQIVQQRVKSETPQLANGKSGFTLQEPYQPLDVEELRGIFFQASLDLGQAYLERQITQSFVQAPSSSRLDQRVKGLNRSFVDFQKLEGPHHIPKFRRQLFPGCPLDEPVDLTPHSSSALQNHDGRSVLMNIRLSIELGHTSSRDDASDVLVWMHQPAT
jgi:hypothetical protein